MMIFKQIYLAIILLHFTLDVLDAKNKPFSNYRHFKTAIE